MDAKEKPKRGRGRPAIENPEEKRVMIGVQMVPRFVEKLDRLARAQRRTRSAQAAILLEDALEEFPDTED